jgi:hypothetical protein
VVAIYFVGDDMIFSFFSLPWGRKKNWEELGDDDDQGGEEKGPNQRQCFCCSCTKELGRAGF